MTFQELKKLKNDIAVKTGLDTAAAARVIGYYNIGSSSRPDIIQAMINGDMSPVGPALVALGITPENITDITPDNVHTSGSASAGPVVDNITDGAGSGPDGVGDDLHDGSGHDLVGGPDIAPDGPKIAPQRKKKPQASKSVAVKEKTITSPQALQNDLVKAPDGVNGSHDDLGPDITTNTPHNETIIDTLPPAQALPTPAADPDIITDPDYSELLPVGLYDDITATIDDYCKTHDITDKKKIHPLEWQAVCAYIGKYIKQSKVLHDFQREKIHGGTVYDGRKVCALLDLYGVMCSEFKQVAFSHNFPRFAGVSVEYFKDYMQRGLTSSRVGLPQKAFDLQRASLVGAVTGGGSATVGNIFLSKALAGLQETVTVQHVTTESTQIIDAVPDLSRAGLPGPV